MSPWGLVPCDVDAGDVGECFATAGDRELHELGGDGSENDEHQGQRNDEDRGVTPAVIPAPSTKATKEQEAKAEVAEQREEPDESHCDRRDQDVVVANVAELMRENTFKLGAVHDLQQAGSGRDRRVLRVAPRSERVRRALIRLLADLMEIRLVSDGPTFLGGSSTTEAAI